MGFQNLYAVRLIHRPSPHLLTVAFLVLFLIPTPLLAVNTAKSLFENLKQQVFQIRVIDVASGDKFSLGSGFQVSDQGQIATNFHVVSAYVHEPDKYRLEIVTEEGEVGTARLINFDVIHDLALIHVENLTQEFMELNLNALDKGDRIYSIGNPHDLGMTIVEGTYNGLIKTSRYQKLLFSGSLNPGMSGGPAIDSAGRVIGINVSTGGEQISFLVPVDQLAILLEGTDTHQELTDAQAVIREALFNDQEQFYHSLLQDDFALEPLGELNLPGELDEALRCWGHSPDTKEKKYESAHKHCASQDAIFIKDTVTAGGFSYDAEWLRTEQLNPLQFYTVLESRFSHHGLYNAYDEEDVSQFSCYTSFVSIAGHDWKASNCFRAYKDYEGLYDAMFLMSSVDSNDRAAIVKTAASMISRENALALFRKVMESVQWTL
ncbi:MAG: serine protease Do [Halioglobus sp.]